MRRLGDLLPEAARRLGIEDDLRLARAIARFEALVAERVPAAAGAARLVRVDDGVGVVEAELPIVAQELRLRGRELARALSTAPGGLPVGELRIIVRRGPSGSSEADPRV